MVKTAIELMSCSMSELNDLHAQAHIAYSKACVDLNKAISFGEFQAARLLVDEIERQFLFMTRIENEAKKRK